MSTLLLLALLMLQIADGLTTWYALARGKGREKNPIVGWFIDRFGLLPGLVIVKGAGVVAGILLYFAAGFIWLLAFTLIYAYIVRNNYEIASNGRS